MELNKIYIMKESKTKATISLRFSEEHDDECYFVVSGIILDLTDVSSPVRSLKADGQEIIRGTIFDGVLTAILDSFLEIQDESNGLYIRDEEKIEKG